ncbi:hypothetical protein RA210_U10393 [Rubrivivax sp. A210]|uniref:hypothetical protein n=1 Tax=Rubrivivax sp. A210 TaxID=2772301 RepID=UPI001919CAFC|nr:hypothetical protein [Rubrivivax sp. A210]CAD5366572.1 hypothetical protein RA210_U10393 [Rubrivivax sp. A210]
MTGLVEVVAPRWSMRGQQCHGRGTPSRGWMGIALSRGPKPDGQEIDQLIEWPCSADRLGQLIDAMQRGLVGQWALRLYGDGGCGGSASAEPSAALELSVWFMDQASVAGLVGPVDYLLASGLNTHCGRAVAVYERLEPLLLAMPRLVPGCSYTLDAASPGPVARRLVAEVRDLEISRLGHSRCLEQMPRCLFEMFSWSTGESRVSAAYSASVERKCHAALHPDAGRGTSLSA